MKKFIYIIILLLTINSYSQYQGNRQNAPLVRTETYVTNSPGNSIANSWLTGFNKDSTAIAYGYPSFQLWKFKSNRNDGTPTSIAWFDNEGYIKRSSLPSWITTEVDPKWTSDKVNYYDKTVSDARYLQSYTETDPLWTAVSTLYRTKTQNDLLYQTILGFTPVPNTRTINGQVLSSNITLTKSDIGLSNIDNTSDLLKPISNLTQTALDNKVSITRTVNSQPLSSNVVITKSDVGLSNVDNTSDINKPISTLTQTALNTKLSAEVDGSITNEIQTISISGNTISLNLGGGSINLPALPDYTNKALVTTAGNAIFYITNDKTSTGTALYTNINFVSPIVNDSTLNYTYSWSYNSSTKALTANAKVSTGLTVLGLQVLGTPANVANGTEVYLLVKGN